MNTNKVEDVNKPHETRPDHMKETRVPALTRSVPQKPLLPETLCVTESARSMPTQSPLLGPEFSGQTPGSFLAYVASLYRDQRAKRTRTNAIAVKPLLKGRITKTLTKARFGTYGIQNTKTEVVAHLPFDKERRIPVRSLPEAAQLLGVTSELLRKFITVKKYVLLDSDLPAL